MGVAVGALVRNQVAGVVGALILAFVVSPLIATIDETAVEFTPFGAAFALAGDPQAAGTLSWAGAALVAGRLDAAAADRGDRRRAPPRLGMTDAAGSRHDERRPRGWRSLAFDVALALLATGLELASVTDASGTASVPAQSSWRSLPAARSCCAGQRRSRCWRRHSRPRARDRGPRRRARRRGWGDRALHHRRHVRAQGVARGARADGRDRRGAVGSRPRTRRAGRPRPRSARPSPCCWSSASGRSAPTRRRGVATRARSRNARPTPNASASSWPGSRSTRSGRRSPASCTTSSPTRSA